MKLAATGKSKPKSDQGLTKDKQTKKRGNVIERCKQANGAPPTKSERYRDQLPAVLYDVE